MKFSQSIRFWSKVEGKLLKNIMNEFEEEKVSRLFGTVFLPLLDNVDSSFKITRKI